jgi:hypothetical protein
LTPTITTFSPVDSSLAIAFCRGSAATNDQIFIGEARTELLYQAVLLERDQCPGVVVGPEIRNSVKRAHID